MLLAYLLNNICECLIQMEASVTGEENVKISKELSNCNLMTLKIYQKALDERPQPQTEDEVILALRLKQM